MIKIGIVDDKKILRQNLIDEVQYEAAMEVVLVAENGLDFLEKMKNIDSANHPEIVLMDIDMPIKNGIEAVRDGKLLHPDVEFLMLTVFDDDVKVFEAIKAGASGYLLKDESTITIIQHIKQVKEHKTVPMSPSIARKALRFLSQVDTNESTPAPPPSYGLTPREKEVLKGMVKGHNYKEIANHLIVSPHTVRNQISSIYNKLHVKNKVDAVKIALNRKIVE